MMQMRGGGGGRCIGMYGSGGGDADVAWKMGRIMLRFRPIAPKPAAAHDASAADEPPAPRRARGMSGSTRVSKRKGGGGAAGGSRRKKAQKIGVESKSFSSPATSSTSTTASTYSSVTTLPLMPETPERREVMKASAAAAAAPPALPSRIPSAVVAPYESSPWFPRRRAPNLSGAEVVVPRPVRPSGSLVIVDCVTHTWLDGLVGAAASDAAVLRALATDCSCPGFITDELHRVVWTNEAYRRMVAEPPLQPRCQALPEEGDEEDVKVGLVTRGMVPAASACRAFTCHVRARYVSRQKGKVSLAAPCDVWRLDDGRWTWRLDIKAALSLSSI